MATKSTDAPSGAARARDSSNPDPSRTRHRPAKFRLIWLSDNIAELEKRFQESFTNLQRTFNSIDKFSDENHCVDLLTDLSHVKVLMIVSGALGKRIVPFVHDFCQVNSIFVFCQNKPRHDRWASEWSKVKGVFVDVDLMCQAVEESIRPPLPQPKPAPSKDAAARGSSPLRNSEKSPADRQRELEQALIKATEREVRSSLSVGGELGRLEDSLAQTLQKRVTSKQVDVHAIPALITELKQALVDVITHEQQQSAALLEGLVKRSVRDALRKEPSAASTLETPVRLPNHRKPITIATVREVKITADLKQTCIDDAHRQRRHAVVTDKRLRDLVHQWIMVASMDELTDKIKAHGKNDLERAWLLFCWIGQNIKYESGCHQNAAERVFSSRRAVCRGFAGLYRTCCERLNIQCSEISGHTKQAFLQPGAGLGPSTHAWNRIVLNQFSYLVDPTWGAGGRDNKQKLEEFYFLTSPEELIYTHYCNGSQLLEPEVSKQDFLRLPIMKSLYYTLGLRLLSPKQGINETSENLFQIAIKTPPNVDLTVDLKVDKSTYPSSLHALTQRDPSQSDVYKCMIAPPVDGLYEVGIYAKTKEETTYGEAINMRLRVSDIAEAFTFPKIYSAFTQHNCILIEPLRRFVHKDEQVMLHMALPNIKVIHINNGEDDIVPNKDEYKNGVLKKEVRVQGDLEVCGRWDNNADSISVLCSFTMM